MEALITNSALAPQCFARQTVGRRSGATSSTRQQAGRSVRGAVVLAAKGKGFGKVPEQKPQEEKPVPLDRMPLPPQMMKPAAPTPPPREENPSLPQVVSDRIIGRMVLFSGVPMVLGFASGPVAYYLKVVQKAEMEPAALYTVGTVLFGLAAVGITYGALSASWDPNRDSEGLGLEDFKRNWPLAMEQLPFAKKRR